MQLLVYFFFCMFRDTIQIGNVDRLKCSIEMLGPEHVLPTMKYYQSIKFYVDQTCTSSSSSYCYYFVPCLLSLSAIVWIVLANNDDDVDYPPMVYSNHLIAFGSAWLPCLDFSDYVHVEKGKMSLQHERKCYCWISRWLTSIFENNHKRSKMQSSSDRADTISSHQSSNQNGRNYIWFYRLIFCSSNHSLAYPFQPFIEVERTTWLKIKIDTSKR